MSGLSQRDIPDLLNSLKGLFRVYSIELPDCPVFVTAALPTKPEVTGLFPRLPAGRGLTRAQATVSAAAEAIELIRSLAQNIPPAARAFEIRDGIAYVSCENLSTGNREWIPAQRVYLDFAAVFSEPLLVAADSNGCAVGGSRSDAVNRALLECVERDAVALWWYGRQSRNHFSLRLLDGAAPRLSWWLGDRARHTILIDVSSDLGIPVVAAASAEPDGTGVALGSAAASNVADAALSAVTEMIQTEASMAMGDAAQNVDLQDWVANASTRSMPQFKPAGEADPESRARPTSPLETVKRAGHPIQFIDLTLDADVVASVRVIVPGLCALRGNFDTERILRHCRDNPQFNGITSADQVEVLEPY